MEKMTENLQAVRVKKLPSWVIDTHKHLASLEGKTLEGHLREVLTEMALMPKKKAAQSLENTRQSLQEKYGTNFPDTTELIRQKRDETS